MEKYPLEATRHLPTLRAELPEAIADLVGTQDTGESPDKPSSTTPAAGSPQPISPPYDAARHFQETRQAAALRRFAEQFQADLERVMRYPVLPAVATVRLDDPWA